MRITILGPTGSGSVSSGITLHQVRQGTGRVVTLGTIAITHTVPFVGHLGTHMRRHSTTTMEVTMAGAMVQAMEVVEAGTTAAEGPHTDQSREAATDLEAGSIRGFREAVK